MTTDHDQPGDSWEKADRVAPQVNTTIGRKQVITLVVLALSLAIIIIDSTIVNIALPAIQKEPGFSASIQDLEWIISLYALIFGSFILIWGKIGDEFGRKRIFMAGVSLFVLGSIIDGGSQNLSQMLIGRVFQGFGAAMASPSTLSILTTTFAGKARSVAFGIWGAVAGASAVFGPLLGGYFTTYVTWRWSFYINVPIGAIALIGAVFVIKESRFKNPTYSTDYAGIVMITLSLSAMLFGFIEGQRYGWITPAQTFTVLGSSWPFTNVSLPLVSIVVGLILLMLFGMYEVRRQRKGKDTLFDTSLFKYPAFRYGIITVTIVAMGEFAVIFFLSIYFQVVRGLSAISTGITFLPLALTVFITAPLAGVLANRFGPKWIVTTGMILEGVALFSLSQIITISTPFEYFYPIFAIYGAGVGLAIGQLTSTVLMSVPWQRAGVASGAANTVRQVGSAFGVAVIGAVLAAVITSVGQTDLAASSSIPAALKPILQNVLNTGLTGGLTASIPPQFAAGPIHDAIMGVFQDAITQGTRWAAFTAAIFVSLGAISSLKIPNAKSKIPGEHSGAKVGTPETVNPKPTG